jgi:phage terminase large subunit GpA-like protein
MSSTSLQTLNESWVKSWQIPAKLNPWRWAESNLEFSSRVSPLPGKYSTVSTPYVREVLEAVADPKVRHITLCWSAQSSKTTTALIAIFYTIANDPGNVLLVRPSLQAAKSLAENKIMLVIDENTVLAQQKTGDRNDYQKVMIKLKNMVIFVRGASANQLSAESCKVVVLDETDKYEQYKEEKAEADLVSLAYERTKFYKNHLKMDTSTPTVPSGVIWQMYNEGDMRLYMMPCPNCGAEFNFCMKCFKFDSDKPKQTAHFECPHCMAKIEEHHKPNMMLHGRWVSQNPDADDEHRSYLLPEFYSPVTRWGELADKFIKAQKLAKMGNFGKLHNFINSSLAEPWDPTENARRDIEQLIALCDGRQEGIVPDEAVGLTIGIDTQDLYFEYVIRAWGRDNLQSWLIKHGKLDDFEDIYNLMRSRFASVSGDKQFRITAGLIDSGGHRTAEVYDFCRKYSGLRLRASKGEQTMRRPWEISKIDKMPNGNPMPGGVKLVRINTTYYKDFLAGKLSLNFDEPGAFILHANPDTDYLEHMCAEYRNSKGIWICPSSRRNESFDCEVLNLATAEMLGLKFATTEDKKPDAPPTPPTQKPPAPKKRRLPIYQDNPYTSGIE